MSKHNDHRPRGLSETWGILERTLHSTIDTSNERGCCKTYSVSNDDYSHHFYVGSGFVQSWFVQCVAIARGLISKPDDTIMLGD